MSYERFVAEVMDRGALDEVEARRAVEATLEIVASHLTPEDARAVARALPDPLAASVLRPEHQGRGSADEIYREIGDREGVSVGFAREHAQVICGVLLEQLDPDLRTRLELHGGGAMQELFAPPSPAPEIERPRSREPVPAGEGHTLATGRPRSRHPIAEAVTNAHRDSVARAENPHGDTKLSSSPGTSSAEREGRTLATGSPGSRHPLSEGEG